MSELEPDQHQEWLDKIELQLKSIVAHTPEYHPQKLKQFEKQLSQHDKYEDDEDDYEHEIQPKDMRPVENHNQFDDYNDDYHDRYGSSKRRPKFQTKKSKQKLSEQPGYKTYKSKLDYVNEECTFKPELNPYSIRLASRKANLLQKSQEWVLKRKIVEDRQKFEPLDEDLTECTFKPKINEIPHIVYKPITDYNQKAIDSFLRRQQKAQQEHKRISQLQSFRGNYTAPQKNSTWKRQVTIPKRYDFGKKEGNHAFNDPLQNQYTQKETMSPQKVRQQLKRMDSIEIHTDFVETLQGVFQNPENMKAESGKHFDNAINNIHNQLLELDLALDSDSD